MLLIFIILSYTYHWRLKYKIRVSEFMTREEKTEQIIKILEEYGIIYPPDHQDNLQACQTASQSPRQTEH